MRAIRGGNTQPEMKVRRYLHAVGLRYCVNVQSLPGRPDICLPSRRIAVFVHGCFWHQHPGCPYATKPATRPDFWQAKFAANKSRDALVVEKLTAHGWQVITIWECQMRDEFSLDALAWTILAVQPGKHRPVTR